MFYDKDKGDEQKNWFSLLLHQCHALLEADRPANTMICFGKVLTSIALIMYTMDKLRKQHKLMN